MANRQENQTGPWLRDVEVASYFGVSRPTVWNWTRRIPNFPKPTKLGIQAQRWHIDELKSYKGPAHARP